MHFADGHACHPPIQEDRAVIRLSALRESGLGRFGSKCERQVRAAQRGDREAFDGLVSSHEPEIRKFLVKRIAREQIDDLLQEIWVAAWTSMREFDSRSQFRTWLFGIAINKCKTLYRAQQRKIVHLPLEDYVGVRPNSGRIASDMEARIPSAIEQLSENHQKLLDLYYYAELTLPEISRLLDRNLNTVKYQFYRAHAELAALLREGDTP